MTVTDESPAKVVKVCMWCLLFFNVCCRIRSVIIPSPQLVLLLVTLVILRIIVRLVIFICGVFYSVLLGDCEN